MAAQFNVFARQTWALTKKTLRIAVIRHWFSTSLRALVLPIAFLVLLLEIKHLIIENNGYGVGSPFPVQSLENALPNNKKLVFVQPPGLGADVQEVITKITSTLTPAKQVVFLTDVNDLLTTCRQNLDGTSDCFAAVVFDDSPLTTGPSSKGTWTYTIRADNQYNGFIFHVGQNNNNEDVIYLPLQVALENAMTNSTIIPNHYMFTSITQAEADKNAREQYQRLVISTYGIAFFISMVSPIYHSVSMITSERESGMTQLIDAMGGSPAARISAYVLAFDIIYTPCWVTFGFLFWNQLFLTSSLAISLFWQILVGWAITSASVFSAMFFSRAQMSGIWSIIGFLVVALCGQIIDWGSPRTATVAAMSLLFPSMNYVFMTGYMCRYEEQALPTNLLRAAKSTSVEASTSRVPGIILWVFMIIQIVVYPLLAVYAEKWVHGSKSKDRTMGVRTNGEDSLIAITTSGLTKIYPPTFRRKWLTWTKSIDVIAVEDLDLVARQGQILCLLGANGSGKTTTLDMIGGLQKLTRGSINVVAGPSQTGICPQRNVLWSELTVEEHVHIWNQIKFSKENKKTCNNLIEACDLALKKNAQASTLSGGQKRKLQLACTFVGGSTVCLLDEVTSGLDPLSRRIIWDIIRAERAKRTMILTTHFLDEADFLADQVMIISKGRLKCQGSTVELKSTLGGGYRVHLRGAAKGPDMDFPMSRIRNQTVYNTPDSASAASLISRLEEQQLSDLFVNGPTIEDVFLRVAEEPHVAQEGEPEVRAEPIEDELEKARSKATPGWDNQLSSGEETTFVQQVLVLLRKRWNILLRNWWPYLIVLAIPLAVTPNLHPFLLLYHIPSCLDLTADVHSPEQFNFQLGGFYSSQYAPHVLIGPQSLNSTLFNVVSNFLVGVGVNLSNYTSEFVFSDSLASFQNDLAINFTNFLPGALYMENNFSAPTYAYLGDNGILPALLMQNLWSQIRSGIPIVGYFTFFNSLISPTAGNSLQYLTYFCLAQAVYPALFALYPTYEKTRQVRALQYSNGIRATPLWAAYTFFDFLFILVISAACTAIIATQEPHWFGAAYMFPVLVLYGVSATLLAYIFSLVAKSQLAAFAYAAGIQAIMFLLSIMGFVLSVAFENTSQLQRALDGTNFGLSLIFPIGNVVRAVLVGLNVYIVNCRNGNFVSSPRSIYAYGGPILYLCLQICFLFWLLLWLEGNHAIYFPRLYKSHVDEEDEVQTVIQEVIDEKNRVESSDSDLLRVLHLVKTFGSNRAVDDVSFGLSPGEILALLGPNGAGKSTIINIIRGELQADQGSVLLQGVDMAQHARMGRRHLGYCPQFDALDIMTIREHLELYARAKGIPAIEADVNLVMEKIGLQPYESRLASKLSGGNKRKLSLAIAILGNPSVLLLDEPSSSMDAASKRVMWKTLAEVTAGRSLLLTTHSMEEADALATRAAILSKRILALGTTDYLRQKYGNVYHIHLVLKSTPTSTREEMDAVEEWISHSFSEVTFDSYGNYHGQIKFSVPAEASAAEDVHGEDSITRVDERRRNSGVGALFSVLEGNKENMGLQFYSVRATTMDEVFLNVVREQADYEKGSA